MQIPRSIEIAIEERAKAAERFNHYDYKLSKWLDDHGVITESCDTFGGVESIVNPYSSANRVREAIEKHKQYEPKEVDT